MIRNMTAPVYWWLGLWRDNPSAGVRIALVCLALMVLDCLPFLLLLSPFIVVALVTCKGIGVVLPWKIKAVWNRSAGLKIGSTAVLTIVFIAAFAFWCLHVLDAGFHRIHPDDAVVLNKLPGGRSTVSIISRNQPERHILGLRFREHNADDDVVKALIGLACLKKLDLSDNPGVTDVSVPFLLKMKTLNELDIRGTSITPDGSKKLEQRFYGIGGVYAR